ncbi:MAG: response regulator [Phormidesmis sp.]
METETLESLSANNAVHILVIEDNDDSAYLVQFFLEDLGYSVAVARSGKNGLAMVRSHHPDIVISDIGLGDELDGYAIAQAIRADKNLHSTYLIATSGYASQEDKERCMAAGFDECLAKPLALPLLGQIVARWVAELTEEKSDAASNLKSRVDAADAALVKRIQEEETSIFFLFLFFCSY